MLALPMLFKGLFMFVPPIDPTKTICLIPAALAVQKRQDHQPFLYKDTYKSTKFHQFPTQNQLAINGLIQVFHVGVHIFTHTL